MIKDWAVHFLYYKALFSHHYLISCTHLDPLAIAECSTTYKVRELYQGGHYKVIDKTKQ
jgi:hypothetical protein